MMETALLLVGFVLVYLVAYYATMLVFRNWPR
jgi:hypothetical protein